MKLEKTSFKEFITLQRGYDLPISKIEEGDFPVLGSTGIIGFHNKAKIKSPGVVTGRSGTIGLVHHINMPYWPHNTSLWVRDFKGNNIKYVYYKLKTLNLKRFNGGASVPTLNRNTLDNLIISVHDKKSQDEITRILSTYDDSIDINQKRIHLLEQAARLLYREWFVYFRFPGHENVKMIDGIPEGWKRSCLKDIALVRKGKNITFEQAVDGDIPVVGGGLKPTYYNNKTNVKAPVITISASGANAGFVNLYDTDIWASDCSYIDKKATKFIYYLYLNLKYLQKNISGFQVGAAQPHVYPKDLSRLRIIKPSEAMCKNFEELVKLKFDLIRYLKVQNQKLAQARDLLLARLMSGKIDVSEINNKIPREAKI